jgi:hypothetical protein
MTRTVIYTNTKCDTVLFNFIVCLVITQPMDVIQKLEKDNFILNAGIDYAIM